MSVSFCLPHHVAVSVFIICSMVCACTEIVLVCVQYVSLGSEVRPITFGRVAMGSAVLFSCRSRFILYYAGSGVNRVQVVLSGFSVGLFCFVHAKTLCRYGCIYFMAALVLVCVEVMWCHMRRSWTESLLWVVVCLQCKCWIVFVKGRHRVERQFWIHVLRMCDFNMLCRFCVPWCSFWRT